MAGLKNIVLAASLLAPLAAAIPMLNERAIFTHTVVEVAWVTVEETTTVWVDPSNPTPPPAPVVPEASITSNAPPAVFAAPTYVPSTFATVAAASSSQAQASPPPAESSSVPDPEPTVINMQPKDVSVTGTCEGNGNACVGDVTHWDGGLGACGWNVDSNSEMAIALPFGFMGTQSNGNPYCGRAVTLYNPTSGTTVQATVGDKCMGCVDRAIDCTNILFNAITDGKGDGRMAGIQWWFT